MITLGELFAGKGPFSATGPLAAAPMDVLDTIPIYVKSAVGLREVSCARMARVKTAEGECDVLVLEIGSFLAPVEEV